jgi:hypothetical protein
MQKQQQQHQHQQKQQTEEKINVKARKSLTSKKEIMRKRENQS